MASIITESTLLRFISKPVTSLLSIIFKSAHEIRELVRRVKVNKHQCLQLSERINIVVGFLKDKQLDDTLSEPMKAALISFAEFLQKCLEFINIFINAGPLKRLWNNKDYFLQFTELHNELSQHETDLSLGIQLTYVLVNKSQGENDCQPNLVNRQQITHREAIDNEEQQQNIFESGIWIYRRCLNEKWQDVFRCHLIFDPDTKRLTGCGEDNFGYFTVNGPFCQEIRAIEMTWLYKNHLQIIQLQWDKDRNVLCGMSFEKKEATDQVCRCMGQFEMALFTSS